VSHHMLCTEKEEGLPLVFRIFPSWT